MPTNHIPTINKKLHSRCAIDEDVFSTKSKENVNHAGAWPNSARNNVDLYRSLLGGTDRILHYDHDIPHFNEFPNEVVSSIVSHLSQQKGTLYQCALVSQKFNAIAIPLLWHTLALDNDAISVRFLSCLSIMSHHHLSSIGHHTRRLLLTGHQWTDETLERLIPCLPLLDHLTINNDLGITDAGFCHVIQHCTQITSLKLMCTSLTDVSFTTLGRSCHRLVNLEWQAAAQHQTSSWLGMFPQLQRLHIHSHRVSLNDNDMAMIQSFRHLICLEIVDLFTTHMDTLLASPATSMNSAPQSHWPQLTMLTLGPCLNIGAATLVAFLQTHPHLQSLNLMNAPEMTDATLDAIPDLTSLTLTSCPRVTAGGLRRFVRTCRSLQHVTLFCCDGVNAYGLSEASFDCMTVTLDQMAIKRIKGTK